MATKEEYESVLSDLTKDFDGTYAPELKRGSIKSRDYIFGIAEVMFTIAERAGSFNEYESLFYENMTISENNAKDEKFPRNKNGLYDVSSTCVDCGNTFYFESTRKSGGHRKICDNCHREHNLKKQAEYRAKRKELNNA